MPTLEQLATFLGGGIAAVIGTVLTYRRGTKQDSASSLQQRRELELKEFSVLAEAQRSHMGALEARIQILSDRLDHQAQQLTAALEAVATCEQKHRLLDVQSTARVQELTRENQELRARVAHLESRVGGRRASESPGPQPNKNDSHLSETK